VYVCQQSDSQREHSPGSGNGSGRATAAYQCDGRVQTGRQYISSSSSSRGSSSIRAIAVAASGVIAVAVAGAVAASGVIAVACCCAHGHVMLYADPIHIHFVCYRDELG